MTHPSLILKTHGLRPRKSLGQNFLFNKNILERIAQALEADRRDFVLEIGPGLGALTRELAVVAGSVAAVEIDNDLANILEQEVADLENVEVVRADILKYDPQPLTERAGRPILVCSNLPYYLSTEVLFYILKHQAWINRAVLMFQKEVAVRICADPGGKDYGILSVLAQYRCAIEPVMDVDADNFHPSPKVGSAVIRLRIKQEPEPAAADEKLLAQLVKTGFGQRRKTLGNSLKSLGGPDKLHLAALERAAIDPIRRAETVAVKEWVALTNTWDRAE